MIINLVCDSHPTNTWWFHSLDNCYIQFVVFWTYLYVLEVDNVSNKGSYFEEVCMSAGFHANVSVPQRLGAMYDGSVCC